MPIHILRTLVATFTVATAFVSAPAAIVGGVGASRVDTPIGDQTRQEATSPHRRTRPDDGCREIPAAVVLSGKTATSAPSQPISCASPDETVR